MPHRRTHPLQEYIGIMPTHSFNTIPLSKWIVRGSERISQFIFVPTVIIKVQRFSLYQDFLVVPPCNCPFTFIRRSPAPRNSAPLALLPHLLSTFNFPDVLRLKTPFSEPLTSPCHRIISFLFFLFSSRFAPRTKSRCASRPIAAVQSPLAPFFFPSLPLCESVPHTVHPCFYSRNLFFSNLFFDQRLLPSSSGFPCCSAIPLTPPPIRSRLLCSLYTTAHISW